MLGAVDRGAAVRRAVVNRHHNIEPLVAHRDTGHPIGAGADGCLIRVVDAIGHDLYPGGGLALEIGANGQHSAEKLGNFSTHWHELQRVPGKQRHLAGRERFQMHRVFPIVPG